MDDRNSEIHLGSSAPYELGAALQPIRDAIKENWQYRHVDRTVSLVAAFLAHNATPAVGIPDLLRSVHDAIAGLGKVQLVKAQGPLVPAVPIKRSITEDFIISLEDGRKLKSMKRYLAKLGMTPAEYRAKWGLPADYPMVAPSYAAQRSELAKRLGLGRRLAEAA